MAATADVCHHRGSALYCPPSGMTPFRQITSQSAHHIGLNFIRNDLGWCRS